LTEELIHFLRYQEAFFDWQHFVGSGSFETQLGWNFSCFVVSGMELDLVAVAQGSGAGGDVNFWQIGELANPHQLISDEVSFQFQLLRVADMLVMASAADREVGAG